MPGPSRRGTTSEGRAGYDAVVLDGSDGTESPCCWRSDILIDLSDSRVAHTGTNPSSRQRPGPFRLRTAPVAVNELAPRLGGSGPPEKRRWGRMSYRCWHEKVIRQKEER